MRDDADVVSVRPAGGVLTMRAIIAATLAILASPALAQDMCGPYDAIAKELSATYAERRIAQAITLVPVKDPVSGQVIGAEQALVELWASKDGGTFTILRVQQDGKACIVLDGATWTPASHKFDDGRPS